LNGVTYVHIRITFDPSFVDNVYGTDSNRTDSGWHMRGGNHVYGHTFDPDLVKSDHTEILLTDATGATVISFHQDYISADPSQPCGYGSLGVTGGDGMVTTGDPTKVLAVTTSLERNLNGCGYCTAARAPRPATVPIDHHDLPGSTGQSPKNRPRSCTKCGSTRRPGSAGGQAYMTHVHALRTRHARRPQRCAACPPTWDSARPPAPSRRRQPLGSPPGGSGGAGNGGAERRHRAVAPARRQRRSSATPRRSTGKSSPLKARHAPFSIRELIQATPARRAIA
jgi:hypothetical protein